MTLKAIALNATLSRSPRESSTQKLLNQIIDELAKYDCETRSIRLVDHNIKSGVSHDEGKGDAWPSIRDRLMDADILLLGTPIWMGQPSSECKRVLERMDAILGDIDDNGCYPTFGKVAIAAIVGNEDGAHHVTAELYQALTDVGFSIPGGSSAYWVGEAMSETNYVDLTSTPKSVKQTIRVLARNAAHLASTLRVNPYPDK